MVKIIDSTVSFILKSKEILTERTSSRSFLTLNIVKEDDTQKESSYSIEIATDTTLPKKSWEIFIIENNIKNFEETYEKFNKYLKLLNNFK